MADGPWYSNSGPGDQNQALVTTTLKLALDETSKNGDALGSPVIRAILGKDRALGPLIAALGVNVGRLKLGVGSMAATAEGTAASPTNYSSGGSSLTPSRRAFSRQLSDYGAKLSQGVLVMSMQKRAQLIYDFTGVWANTLIEEIAALASSATNTSGASGASLTWSELHKVSLRFRDRGVRGPLHCKLDLAGVRQLSADALSLGGAVAMSQQVQQFLQGGGSGALIGQFFGNMYVYMSSELEDDGSGNTLGMAFSEEGVHTKHETVPYPEEAVQVANVGMWRAEARRPGGGVSTIEAESYMAVGIDEQNGLEQIKYTATVP